MAATPTLGIGTKLEIDFGSGYQPVALLREVPEFGGEAADVDITTHDNAGGGWRSYMPGLQDPPETAFKSFWTGDSVQTAVMQAVLNTATAQINYPVRITLPSGLGVWQYSGFVKAAKLNPVLDGPIEFNGTFKASGPPTFATDVSTGLTTPFFVVTGSTGTTSYVPTQSGTVYDYVVTVDTAATTVTVTPTASAGVIKVNGTIVATGVASGNITLGAAGTVTLVTIEVKETNKVAKYYLLRIARP